MADILELPVNEALETAIHINAISMRRDITSICNAQTSFENPNAPIPKKRQLFNLKLTALKQYVLTFFANTAIFCQFFVNIFRPGTLYVTIQVASCRI